MTYLNRSNIYTFFSCVKEKPSNENPTIAKIIRTIPITVAGLIRRIFTICFLIRSCDAKRGVRRYVFDPICSRLHNCYVGCPFATLGWGSEESVATAAAFSLDACGSRY